VLTSLAFSRWMLVASRARTTEAVSGLMNLSCSDVDFVGDILFGVAVSALIQPVRHCADSGYRPMRGNMLQG